MAVLKNIAQRLFGRTVIDSLDLNQNAWYIDEEQVTVTAAQLNGASILPATSQTVDVANDDVLFLDHTGAHAAAYDSIADLMALVAGTTANSGITSTNGVFKVDPHAVTTETIATGDLFLFSDEATGGDPLRATTVDNYAVFLAGTSANSGITPVNGVFKVDPHVVTAETPASGDLFLFSDEGTGGDPLRSVTIDNYATFVAGVAAVTGLGASAGTLVVAPADVVPTLATDYIHTGTAANVTGKMLMTGYATAIAGDGLAATSGVLALDFNELTHATFATSTDSLAFLDSDGNVVRKDTWSDIVSYSAGSGVITAGGQISISNMGHVAVGGVLFTGAGDCDAISVGGILFTRDATPDITLGEWSDGAGKAASVANFAAAVMGDTRNAGTTYYTSLVDGDVVWLFTKTSAVGGAVALTGAAPTEPSSLQNLVGGLAAIPVKTTMITYTVTAFDDALAGFNIPLPFAPTEFMVQVRTSAGVPKYVTDQFTVQATPNRIHVVIAGATSCVATDTVTIYASE